MLSQLLKLNGASKVVVAANKGIKMDIAKDLEAADVYIELDRWNYLLPLALHIFSPALRTNPGPQWQKLKEDHPFGFDIVVEATGVESIVQDSINYVRRGGTLLVYGVYEDKARVSWPPSKIFSDEIRVYYAQALLVL
jgi:D-arabinitol dehydrogenase (NADP+)